MHILVIKLPAHFNAIVIAYIHNITYIIQKTTPNIPVILNTSFNVKGQPIVNNPEDAIKCFLKYKIDLLAIGDYLVSKKSK